MVILKGLLTSALIACCFFVPTAPAADKPFRAGTAQDFAGVWRQVDVGALNPKRDIRPRWYSGKQFFWFFPDGFKSLQADEDRLPPEIKAIWSKAPVIQKIVWLAPGRANFTHPQTPPTAVEIGVFTRDANVAVPGVNGKVAPRKGDMVVVYYMNGDPDFYRLLRYESS